MSKQVSSGVRLKDEENVMKDLLFPPLLIGILFVMLAVPLLIGKVKMNHTYGFRLKKAFESQENWLKINKYGAKLLLLWGVLLILIGFIPRFIPIQNRDVRLLIGLTACVIMVVVICVKTHSYAKKL